MSAICGKASALFFVLAISMSILMCQAIREDVLAPEIYEIDYNGPQTHALPPPGSAISRGSVPDHSGVKDIGKQKRPIHP